jgi:hypothetical protein
MATIKRHGLRRPPAGRLPGKRRRAVKTAVYVGGDFSKSPALSDKQWQKIAGLLGTDDLKWRARIDHILNFCSVLVSCQRRDAAQSRDHSRVKAATKSLERAARLLRLIEVDKQDDVLTAVELYVNRLNVQRAGPSRKRKRGRERFPERDFCVNLLLSRVWRKARAGTVVEPEAIGDKNGPLAMFLAKAYEPIEVLTPSTVIEIARLPRRRPDLYSRDRWKWGDLDLQHLHEVFDQHDGEYDEASERYVRGVAQMGARQARQLEELFREQAREIQEARGILSAVEIDETLERLTAAFDEAKAILARRIDDMQRGNAP